jgi:hypothetical protein
VQRGRDEHERGGDLEVLHEGNAHGLAQEAVVIRESQAAGRILVFNGAYNRTWRCLHVATWKYLHLQFYFEGLLTWLWHNCMVATSLESGLWTVVVVVEEEEDARSTPLHLTTTIY